MRFIKFPCVLLSFPYVFLRFHEHILFICDSFGKKPTTNNNIVDYEIKGVTKLKLDGKSKKVGKKEIVKLTKGHQIVIVDEKGNEVSALFFYYVYSFSRDSRL